MVHRDHSVRDAGGLGWWRWRWSRWQPGHAAFRWCRRKGRETAGDPRRYRGWCRGGTAARPASVATASPRTAGTGFQGGNGNTASLGGGAAGGGGGGGFIGGGGGGGAAGGGGGSGAGNLQSSGQDAATPAMAVPSIAHDAPIDQCPQIVPDPPTSVTAVLGSVVVSGRRRRSPAVARIPGTSSPSSPPDFTYNAERQRRAPPSRLTPGTYIHRCKQNASGSSVASAASDPVTVTAAAL